MVCIVVYILGSLILGCNCSGNKKKSELKT